MSGPIPAWEPASIVTVLLKDCEGPTATTRAGTSAWPRSWAAWVRPSYDSSRLRSKPAVSTSLRSAEFSASRSRISSLSAPWLRSHEGTVVKGRTTAAVTDSTGPKASPTARRAGSTAESGPPW